MLNKRRQSAPASGQAGFTLVEALLAMTLLGIAVTSILTTFSGALTAGRVSQDRALVTMLMDDLRNYVRAGLLSPLQVNQGTFTQYPEYAWQVVYTQTEIVDFYQVQMVIQWQRGSRSHRYQVVTYHYDTASTAEALGGEATSR